MVIVIFFINFQAFVGPEIPLVASLMSILAVLFLLSIVVALFMEKEYQMRVNAMKEFDLIVSILLIF